VSASASDGTTARSVRSRNPRSELGSTAALRATRSDLRFDPSEVAKGAPPLIRRTLTAPEHIPHSLSAPMYVIHGVALVGPFLVRFSWGYVALAFALYLARMLALSGAYHRYFAHRSYKTGPPPSEERSGTAS
jgi:hypothetical protein